MNSTRAVLLTATLILLAISPASADGDAILGLWSTAVEDHGYAHVEIAKDNDRYHGRIVWLSQPDFPADDAQGMGGKPKVDRENPDTNLRGRPVVGIRILNDIAYAGNSQWKRGTIYDPANGKTYKCNLKLQDDDTLKVRGYIGVSLLGRTTFWKREKDASP